MDSPRTVSSSTSSARATPSRRRSIRRSPCFARIRPLRARARRDRAARPPLRHSGSPLPSTHSDCIRRIRRQLSMPPPARETPGTSSRASEHESCRRPRDAVWERPRPGGGTSCIPVPPRSRAPCAADPDRDHRGRAASPRTTGGTPPRTRAAPPPVRRCRDALGLTNAEMAPMLDVPEYAIELMCAGRTEARDHDATKALAELQRLCTGVASWHSPRGRVWKLMREPHPACDGARPVDALQARREHRRAQRAHRSPDPREQGFVVDRRWNDRRRDRAQRVA